VAGSNLSRGAQISAAPVLVAGRSVKGRSGSPREFPRRSGSKRSFILSAEVQHDFWPASAGALLDRLQIPVPPIAMSRLAFSACANHGRTRRGRLNSRSMQFEHHQVDTLLSEGHTVRRCAHDPTESCEYPATAHSITAGCADRSEGLPLIGLLMPQTRHKIRAYDFVRVMQSGRDVVGV